MTEMKKHVEDLIAKAAGASDSGEAMKFAQAALNAANAMCSLNVVAKESRSSSDVQ